MTDLIENRTYDEIQVGDSASVVRVLSRQDIELFAIMSGDVNPAHLDDEYAKDSMFHGIIAHGMWGGALISTVLGTKMPGPGTIYLGQDLSFRRPVSVDDTITVTVTAKEKQDDKKIVIFDCKATNQDGKDVILGVAKVIAPSEKISRPRVVLPEVQVMRHERHNALLARCQFLDPVKTAVVHPCDVSSLTGAIEAASKGLIEPILVGPEDKIRAVAAAQKLDIGSYRIVSVEHSHAAAEVAVALAKNGEVNALMKGSLHTDELMGAVVKRENGLRTDRRISHVFVMDVPTYTWPLLITDAAINVTPGLEEKKDICQNAIDLAHYLGIENPKVAILAAVETVNPAMPSTIDAAALCKMADRGQITGGTLDGPLAFDNAISVEAARTKGIVSPVAGHAQILLVPTLEAGNMVAKQLSYLAEADGAGIVLGARVPIILTSRADGVRSRLDSCAIALLTAHGQRAKLEAKREQQLKKG
ncbi:MAG: bifunctional enoyl-CoA hydratase/phosphate acetyltransferase [Alphaproteobacteria bacterium]|nr:MAG: bifunctional enoyl-CoA hydratase/phosphate acetyltransferase [Alphaproteobacteria bacterium]